ncbi:MAG: HD domain-containing protein [Candidatus Syntrophonatronum acetioxidans]|uniref:HD domain-containing protein n=1 Tax=Candidatus Syntrophonatronum acetioxidans TaxID=1795816 RepID=A0A424YIR0_9FIRM|nr:MAG: HD domain-containing protein [Candidatus Syntrophonatronum acetioxidans]
MGNDKRCNKTNFVKDLKVGDRVNTLLAVIEKNLINYSTPNRAGEQFMRLLLGDVSGTITGVVWDNAPEISRTFERDDIVQVKGEINDYKGPQIIINSIQKVSKEEVDPASFQAATSKDRRQMFDRIKELITKKVEGKFLKRLLFDFFKDEEFCRSFVKAPGGRLIHHNYVGGLMEHSLEVAEVVLKMVDLYPDFLNKDLLVTSAILHDIGKIKEYDLNSISFQMTDRGKLIGHITMGREMVMERALKIDGYPEDIMLELEHMVLSHHGKKEWGAPEIPKTMNAFALYYGDLISARLNQFENLVKDSLVKEVKWSDWDRFLERNVFLPDYLKEE